MLDRGALWDLIYEHYSYFTPVSLRVAAARAGLTVQTTHTMFDDQFLAIEAVPGDRTSDVEAAPDVVADWVERAVAFGEAARKRIEAAKGELSHYRGVGPVALWAPDRKA